MSDLIDRQAAIDGFYEMASDMDYLCTVSDYVSFLESLPSVQPERNQGHWVGIDDEPCDVYECDRCGTTYDTVDNTWDLPNYCPNCGADMRRSSDGQV